MNLKSLLKNIICAMVIAEILTVTVAIAKNNNTQKLAQGKQTMLAESTVIEFNEGVGENLTAKLNTETGELRITGTGKMTEWNSSWTMPWNSYKNKIKTVVIEKGVTSIGNYAFYGCSSLSKIELPSSVTSIGGSTFEGCSSLSQINIPEGVTSIESWAFYGCSSLSEINIPEGVTSIGSRAFYGCSSLSKINIPEGVTSIGYKAFYLCSSLSEINIPEGVTSIEERAFYGCSSLSQIQVEENNKNYSSVNGILFNKEKTEIIKYPAGKKETSYNIPEGVTSIGSDAFSGCSSLSQIDIPNSVTSIGSDAFSESELNITIELSTEETQEIELPSIIKRAQIKDDILYTDKGFTLKNCTLNESKDKLVVNTKEIKTKLASLEIESGALKGLNVNIIPSQIEYIEGVGENITAKLNTETGELRITGTGNMTSWTYSNKAPWYSYKDKIKTVVIEEGVTSIGLWAFSDCSSLSQIELPSSVTSIGDDAFYGCSSLSEINIPEGVTSIGSRAFSGCSSLSQIELPSSVTSIEFGVFEDCSSLSQIQVEENNKNYSSINGILFNKEKTRIIKYPEGKKEASYNIPEGVTSIERYAFIKCSSLSQINIPEGVTSISYRAFYGCRSLSKIELPSSVTNIGDYAFSGCSSLSKIELPSSVTDIGDYAFSGCSSLSEINIPEGVTSIGWHAFYECSSLTINCRSNSYAKEYAVSNNINYTEINPEIISVTGNTEEWTHENVTLKVEAKDDLCGLSEEAYSFDGGATWQKENTKIYEKNTEGIVIKVKTKDGVITTYETINITKITKKHVATGEFIIDKEAKCEEPGSKYKHCVVKNCNEKLEITEIPALGHSFTKYTSNNDATCTKDGTKTAKCDRCEERKTVTEEGSKKPHTEVIDKKVEPTCTKTGLTEGKHCSVCNEVLVAQTEIPALGHNYNNGVCTRCGEKEPEIKVTTKTYKILNNKISRNKTGNNNKKL